MMWNLLFKTPILNILFLFNHLLFNNMGLAIIALTLLVRAVLIPLTLPAMRSSKKLKELKPELDKLKDKHRGDQAKYAQAQMQLYREHGVNPAIGCLPILFSIPFMVALYQVLVQVLSAETIDVINQNLYFGFLKVADLSQINLRFLWLDLAKPDPFYLLPILVGAAQYWSSRLMSSAGRGLGQSPGKEAAASAKKEDMHEMMEMMQTQTQFMFPLMTLIITLRLPAGVSLYWFVSTVFGIIQQKILT